MRSYWLAYVAAWLAAAAWLAFWVTGCSVTQDEVAQSHALCHTDTECAQLETPEYLACVVREQAAARAALRNGTWKPRTEPMCEEYSSVRARL